MTYPDTPSQTPNSESENSKSEEIIYPKDVKFYGAEINQKLFSATIDDCTELILSSLLSSTPRCVMMLTPVQLRYLYSFAAHPYCLSTSPGRNASVSQRSYAQQIHDIFRVVMEVLKIHKPSEEQAKNTKSSMIYLDTTKLEQHEESVQDENIDPVMAFYCLFDLSQENYVPESWQVLKVAPGSWNSNFSGDGGSWTGSSNGGSGNRKRSRRKSSLGSRGSTDSPYRLGGSKVFSRAAAKKAKKGIDAMSTFSLEAAAGLNEGEKNDSGSEDEFSDFEMDMMGFGSSDPVDMEKYKYHAKFKEAELGMDEIPGSSTIPQLRCDDLLFMWKEPKLSLGFIGWILQYATRGTAQGTRRFEQLRPLLNILLDVLQHNLEEMKDLNDNESTSIFNRWITEGRSPRLMASLIVANNDNVSPETVLTFRMYLPKDEIIEYEQRLRERESEEDGDKRGLGNKRLSSSQQPPREPVDFNESVDYRLQLINLITNAYLYESDQKVFHEFTARRLLEQCTIKSIESMFYSPKLQPSVLQHACEMVIGHPIYTEGDLEAALKGEPKSLLRNDPEYSLQVHMVLLKAVIVNMQRRIDEEQQQKALEQKKHQSNTNTGTGESAANTNTNTNTTTNTIAPEIKSINYEVLREANELGRENRKAWISRAAQKRLHHIITTQESELKLLLSR